MVQALALARAVAYIVPMKRIPIAVTGGFFGFFLYVAAVLALSDIVVHLHWAVQAAFFIVAGSVWVFPVRWLMYWSVGKR